MSERWAPTQADYDAMDVSTLTTEDALRDANFNKTQFDVMRFCAIAPRPNTRPNESKKIFFIFVDFS